MIKIYTLIFSLILTTTVFVTLKLTSTIDWSWWFILAPLWIPGLLVGLLAGFIWLIGGIHVQ